MNLTCLGVIPAVFDRQLWAEVPFGFWGLVFFCFGCMVGSFLNVCIHRMPLDQSVVSPPSHCPHCRYSIPWYLNVPLVTWLWLRGRCANCKAPISPRYFLVELLTGVAFFFCWRAFGHESPGVALVYCLLLAGFIVATFIDFEHFIIPDEITLGGIGAGLLCSILVPALHGQSSVLQSVIQSALGGVVGWGITYGVLRLGKLLFGKRVIKLDRDTRVIFSETSVKIAEEETLYEEIFSRDSDRIELFAKTAESNGRHWENVPVRLSPKRLQIGEDSFDPEKVSELVVVTDEIVIPREAMGFGDVKFMGAIGVFLGWQGAIFALMGSSVIGAGLGLLLILLRRRDWSAKLPYGPYLAVAATWWLFGARELMRRLYGL